MEYVERHSIIFVADAKLWATHLWCPDAYAHALEILHKYLNNEHFKGANVLKPCINLHASISSAINKV